VCEIFFCYFLGNPGVTFAKSVDWNLRQPPLLNQNVLDRYQNIFCEDSLCDATGICLFCYVIGITPRQQNNSYFCIFKYARAVKQKAWNEAEYRERDLGETLPRTVGFFLS